MRIALISDMHGNAVALRAALADLEGSEPDLIVSLGDVAQGGPQPSECVDLLRELGCRCVRGNTEDFLLTLDFRAEPIDDPAVRERVLATAQWSREQLGPERLDFLRGFEATVQAGRVLCCHATPTSNEDVVLPETPPDEVDAAEADAVAAGHVHLQWLRRFERTLWFCVGAVGVSPSCEYALVDGETLAVEFRRTRFDVDELLAAARHADFPHYDQWAETWKA